MPDEEVPEFNEHVELPDINIFDEEGADGEEEPAAGDETQEETEAQPEGEEEAQEAEGEPAQEEAPVAEEHALKRSMDDIMRRDMELRRREQAIKEQEKAAQELNEFRQLMKNDPLEAMKRAGGDMSKVFEQIVGPDPAQEEMEKNPVIKRLMGEIDSLKKDLTTKDQQAKQQSQYAVQQQIYAEYGKYAQNNAEQYKMLGAFADKIAPDTMFNLAAQYVQQTGQMPNMADLAKHTDELLLQQGKDMISRLSKLDQFKEYFGGNGESQQGTAQTSESPRGTKTLQNKHTGESPGKTKPPDLRNADPDDVVAAGLAAAAGSMFEE